MYGSLDGEVAAHRRVALPGSARELFARLDAAQQRLLAAEVDKLETIAALCRLHHAVDEDAFGEAAERLTYHGASGTPPVAEYLSLEVSALLGISPASGAGLIGQVLNAVHRHPILWDAVRGGAVRWYRATEVMSEVNTARLSMDAARWVDERITPLLSALPRGRALKVLRGLIAQADPALAREREEKARAARHVTLWQPSLDDGPCVGITGRLDVTDARALDATLGRLAEVLAAAGDAAELDVRRATALGILADPTRAARLLDGADPSDVPDTRTATIVLHVTPDSLTGSAAIARLDGHQALIRDTWVELLGSHRVAVRPVIDLNVIPAVDCYEIPDRIRQAVTWRSPVDVFPFGVRAARGCDLDHTIPYDHSRGRPPAQTRIDNLGPLSRRAHRAKTARGWRLRQYEGGWFEWTSPAGYHYATGPFGTLREERALTARSSRAS